MFICMRTHTSTYIYNIVVYICIYIYIYIYICIYIIYRCLCRCISYILIHIAYIHHSPILATSILFFSQPSMLPPSCCLRGLGVHRPESGYDVHAAVNPKHCAVLLLGTDGSQQSKASYGVVWYGQDQDKYNMF